MTTGSKNGLRCENLEKMTFPDDLFDLIITQDVFEHVFHPELAFKEIERVLKIDGAHIFTMPWYPNQKTVQRAKLKMYVVENISDPVYHGNPVDPNGALVTFDWGCDFIDLHSKMTTTVYLQKDRGLGLDAEFLHIFISIKLRKSAKC